MSLFDAEVEDFLKNTESSRNLTQNIETVLNGARYENTISQIDKYVEERLNKESHLVIPEAMRHLKMGLKKVRLEKLVDLQLFDLQMDIKTIQDTLAEYLTRFNLDKVRHPIEIFSLVSLVKKSPLKDLVSRFSIEFKAQYEAVEVYIIEEVLTKQLANFVKEQIRIERKKPIKTTPLSRFLEILQELADMYFPRSYQELHYYFVQYFHLVHLTDLDEAEQNQKVLALSQEIYAFGESHKSDAVLSSIAKYLARGSTAILYAWAFICYPRSTYTSYHVVGRRNLKRALKVLYPDHNGSILSQNLNVLMFFGLEKFYNSRFKHATKFVYPFKYLYTDSMSYSIRFNDKALGALEDENDDFKLIREELSNLQAKCSNISDDCDCEFHKKIESISKIYSELLDLSNPSYPEPEVGKRKASDMGSDEESPEGPRKRRALNNHDLISRQSSKEVDLTLLTKGTAELFVGDQSTSNDLNSMYDVQIITTDNGNKQYGKLDVVFVADSEAQYKFTIDVLYSPNSTQPRISNHALSVNRVHPGYFFGANTLVIGEDTVQVNKLGDKSLVEFYFGPNSNYANLFSAGLNQRMSADSEFSTCKIPKTFSEAISDPAHGGFWLNACKEEVNTLTFGLEKSGEPVSANIDELIPSEGVVNPIWVFKRKFNPLISKFAYKAFLTIHNDTEEPEQSDDSMDDMVLDPPDFTFYPAHLRLMLAESLSIGYTTRHYDFSTSTLTLPSNSKQTISRIPGMIRISNDTSIETTAVLPGSPNSTLKWHDMLDRKLVECGFERPLTSTPIYVKNVDGNVIYLIPTIGDLVFLAPTNTHIEHEAENMRAKGLKINDFGPLRQYRGIRFEQTDGILTLDQSNAIYDKLPQLKYTLQLYTTLEQPQGVVDTPLDTSLWNQWRQTPLGPPALPAQANAIKQVAGFFQYLSNCTRPDLELVSRLLAITANYARPIDFKLCASALQYLERSSSKVLEFRNYTPTTNGTADEFSIQQLESAVDAELFETTIDQNSVVGSTTLYGKCLIDWTTNFRKQSNSEISEYLVNAIDQNFERTDYVRNINNYILRKNGLKTLYYTNDSETIERVRQLMNTGHYPADFEIDEVASLDNPALFLVLPMDGPDFTTSVKRLGSTYP